MKLFQLNLPLLTGTVATTATSDINLSDTVNGVVSVSEAIANHGITIVICGVFLVFIVIMLIMFVRLTSKMIDVFISRMDEEKRKNDEIISKLMSKEIEEEEHKKKAEDPDVKEHKDLVGVHTKHTAVFRSETQNVINKLRCDRVAIYVFHNGNKAYFGFPFIKMSCIFESTLKGMMTVRGRMHTAMPLHLFNDMIDELYHNTDFAANLDEIEIHDSSVKEFLAHSDSKSLFIRGIRNSEDKLAGFSVCEFEHNVDYSDPETYNKIKDALKDMNTAIRHFITDEKEAQEDDEKKDEEIK